MALEIKSPPVLYGKEAQQFLEKVAQFKDDTSKEKMRESMRKTKAIFSKLDLNSYA